MRKTQGSQRGFSVVELILIVVAIGLIGGVGYWAYQHNRPQSSNAARNTGQSDDNKPVTTPPEPTVTYLEIKEWGVKVPLPDSIKDAYYVKGGSSEGPGKAPTTLWLGLKSRPGDACDPDNNNKGKRGAIGALHRVSPTETDPITGQLLTEKYPGGPTVDGYYYIYQSFKADNSCATEEALQSVDSAFASATRSIGKE